MSAVADLLNQVYAFMKQEDYPAPGRLAEHDVVLDASHREAIVRKATAVFQRDHSDPTED